MENKYNSEYRNIFKSSNFCSWTNGQRPPCKFATKHHYGKKFQLFVMVTIVCIAKELGNLNSDLKIKDENPVIATDIILIDAQFCKSA